MKYKIKDLQGGGLKEDNIYNTKSDVIQNLAKFHNSDWSDEQYKDIYGLLGSFGTEDEKIDFLCEYGWWQVCEIEDWQAVVDLIDNIENEYENIEKLEKAMKYFCGTWDICEGYKHALKLALNDQYKNHKSEQDPKDIEKLEMILK